MIGTEKYPDAVILLNYNDDEYSQGYSKTKEVFRSLTKDDNSKHIYLMMILDLQTKRLLSLITIYTFSR